MDWSLLQILGTALGIPLYGGAVVYVFGYTWTMGTLRAYSESYPGTTKEPPNHNP